MWTEFMNLLSIFINIYAKEILWNLLLCNFLLCNEVLWLFEQNEQTYPAGLTAQNYG